MVNKIKCEIAFSKNMKEEDIEKVFIQILKEDLIKAINRGVFSFKIERTDESITLSTEVFLIDYDGVKKLKIRNIE